MPGSTKCGIYQKKNTRSFLGDCGGGKRNKEDGGGGGRKKERTHKDLEEGRFPPAPDLGGGVAQLSRSCGQWCPFCADGGWPRAGMRTLELVAENAWKLRRNLDFHRAVEAGARVAAKDGTSGLRGARRAQLQARSVPGTGMKTAGKASSILFLVEPSFQGHLSWVYNPVHASDRLCSPHCKWQVLPSRRCTCT